MKKTVNSKPIIVAVALIATLAPIIFYAFRIGHVFANALIFNGFSETLLAVMVANAIFMLIYAYRKVRGISAKNSIVYYISAIASIIFLLINLVFAIISPDDIKVMGGFLIELLPWLWIAFGLLFLLFVFPYLAPRMQKIVSVVLIVVVIAIFAIPAFISLCPFAFASEPLVLDNGEEYIIIWATNDSSTGYVEYSYEGENYKIYQENGGRLVTERIHNIKVPYEHLNNNTYSVHSARVLTELSYGGKLGKSISSRKYHFRGDLPQKANIWALADWHCELRAVARATSYLDRPDLVLMLGDYADGYNRLNDIIKYIIAGGAQVTKSECPAILVMGNHDTRGKVTAQLGNMLGLEKFYYQVNKGEFSFLVTDSGEDKPDNHPEYGGVVAFDQFAAGQLKWVQQLEAADNRYVIALSHDEKFNYQDALSEQYYTEMERLRIKLILSGHVHRSEFLEDTYPIPVLIAGGKNGIKLAGTLSYTATQLTIYDDIARIKAVSDKGKVRLEKEFYFNTQ